MSYDIKGWERRSRAQGRGEGGKDRIKQLKQRFLTLDVRVRLGVSGSVSD